MAQFTRCREPLRRVRWIIRFRVIRLVARVAKRAGQVVVVVGMAIGTQSRRHGMRSRQLESRARMIERSIRPLHGVMTRITRSREIRGNVIHRR